MSEKSVKLIENFVSWQGEGPDSGHTMIILRFKTCNLKCPWCDTSVKMRVSAEAPYLLSDIQNTINERRAGILVTGGEPTVPKHIDDAILLLNTLDYPIANVESNGYNLEKLVLDSAGSKNINFMYSPKIFTATDLEQAMEKTKSLLDFDKVYYKIVWQNNDFIKDYCNWLSSIVQGRRSANKIWLMIEGITRADLIRNSPDVFDACEKYKFNFSSRNHIIYGFV
jgi:organic radical activating enzyme